MQLSLIGLAIVVSLTAISIKLGEIAKAIRDK